MSTLPHDSGADEIDLFGTLLDYQQTEEFQVEVKTQIERQRMLNRPHSIRSARKYRANHPDLVLLRSQAEQHKPAIKNQQCNLCYWCGKRLRGKYDLDHITPLIKGGTNDLRNLCVCHPKCNKQKGSRTDLTPAIKKQS